MRSPWPVLTVPLSVVLTIPAVGQSLLLVDGTGATGRFRTIGAAIAAAGNGDIIQVKRGTYAESLVVTGKAVTILGIEANPTDVTVQAPPQTVGLSITNHPAGRISRFARFAIQSARMSSIAVASSGGDVVFDSIVADGECTFTNHTGTVSLTSCVIRSLGGTLAARSVGDLFCHECVLLTQAVNAFLGVGLNVVLDRTRADLSRCLINGSRGGTYLVVTNPGGPAVLVGSSTVRISGLPGDTITGGDGVTTGTRLSFGGAGIVSTASTITMSGTTVRGGLNGQGGRAPATTGPGISTASPPLPVLAVRSQVPQSRSFARGFQTTFDLRATPGAQSITFLAIGFQPSTTPWGRFVIDLGRPTIPLYFVHDAAGLATYTLDLRPLPATFIGVEYAAQTVAIDTALQVSLSGPRIGLIGY